MRSIETRTSTTFFARHRILVPAVAILAVATAGFAAVGGVGLIRSWFMTVEVNGKVVHTGEIQTDENGRATITLPEGSLPKDGEKQISVTLEGSPGEGSGATTVTVTEAGGEVKMQTASQPDPNVENNEK